MPTYFQRPENALKRANEFIDVGKKQRALDALYDVIKSKKHRTWQKIHEPIMEKYLELCVELRKSHIAKEGLYQYKNICQQVNIKSLEDVVRQYIKLAEKKTEDARLESHQVVIDVDDLEMPDTPESLLLKAVSGEDTQDRTDRAILTPWVKFLWESYRQCLDLLRNNSKVEKLYQDIAQQAFKFCLKYARKTEFRKLCDNLRTHLGHVNKHQHQQTAINLNNPESQAMHLETRLAQLDSAIQMELWQEAFKAVEDIHGLISLSKKSPRPSLMANYYSKLGLVFWKSGNHLFHASTLTKLFNLSKDQRKNLSQEELQKMASRVLCATLAVPIPAARSAIDTLLEMGEETAEKQRRLAALVGLTSPPKRQGLANDLAKHNLMQFVYPELKCLYNILEVDFHPLKLYEMVKPCMDYITANEDLCQYVPALEDIIVTRVLKQVAQVYQTVEMSRFAALVPFATRFRLERLIVNAARQLELQVRIDHRNHSLSFGTDLGVSQKEEVPEGPYIQRMPSEVIRMQLTHLAMALKYAVKTIQPRDQNQLLAQLQVQKEELKSQIMNNYKLTAKKEHMRILQRRITIEQRKEQLEKISDQREREEYEQQEAVKRKAMDAEKVRLDSEAKERERQRALEEQRNIQKKHTLERIEQLKKSELGARVVMNIDEEELAKMDVDDIMARQVEQLEREKKELQERLRNQEKKVDHLARAKRGKEIPLLEKQYEDERMRSREFWEHQEDDRIKKMEEEHELQISTRDRMTRMKQDATDFLSQLKDRRKKQYKEKQTSFDKKIVEERRVRLVARKEQRKEERRKKWYTEKDEAEQKARDEALIREREEKEREETEKREQEEREYEEKMARLQEIEDKKIQREREIEERASQRADEMRREAAENKSRGDRGTPGRDRGPGDEQPKQPWKPSGGTSWRDREQQKHDSWKKEGARDDGPDERGPPERRSEPPIDRFARPGPDQDDRDRMRGGDDGGWRRGPPTDDRGPPARDDRAPPARDDRGPPARDSWRDREETASRDRRYDNRDIRLDKEEMSRLERERNERSRAEPPRDGAWKRGGEGGEDRWRRDDGPPKRDDGPPMRRDDGPPMRRDDGPPMRRDDGPPMRRDDGPPLRREAGRGDSWRDRESGGGGGGGSSWRDRERERGGDRGGDRGGGLGGDRVGDRAGDRGGIGGDRGGGGGGGAWRRGGDDRAPRGDDRAPRDDDRRAPPPRDNRDTWKRDAPARDGPPRDKPRDRPPAQEGSPDDEWTTVRR